MRRVGRVGEKKTVKRGKEGNEAHSQKKSLCNRRTNFSDERKTRILLKRGGDF